MSDQDLELDRKGVEEARTPLDEREVDGPETEDQFDAHHAEPGEHV
jgi:hypothetical protein